MRVGRMVAGTVLIACLAGCEGLFGPQGLPPDFIPEGSPIPTEAETVGGYGADGGDTFVTQSYPGRDLVVFEAEHALSWEDGWFLTSEKPGASGDLYLQRDPAGRFAGEGGPAVDFMVRFSHEGTWYCWVRALVATADDNGVFLVDEDGELKPIQWCFASGAWHHSSNLRTDDEHCGIRGLVTYDVKAAGPDDDLTRDIRFRARDAGFRFDRALFVDTLFYIPLGFGPPESDRE